MLKLEDLKVGMRASILDLEKITGTAFILVDVESSIGTIVYIGEPYTDESTDIVLSLQKQGKSVCTIYEPYDSEVSWDE